MYPRDTSLFITEWIPPLLVIQVRCLLEKPVLVKVGQVLTGSCVLRCNTRQSYDVEISIGVEGSNVVSSNVLDLKNPFFRYTGQPVVAPPGNQTTSPTENYWSTVSGDCQGTTYRCYFGAVVFASVSRALLGCLYMKVSLIFMLPYYSQKTCLPWAESL